MPDACRFESINLTPKLTTDLIQSLEVRRGRGFECGLLGSEWGLDAIG